MNIFEITTLTLVLAALFCYLNERFFHLPITTSLLLITLITSVAIIALKQFGIGTVYAKAPSMMADIYFSSTVLQGMLSHLLFESNLKYELFNRINRKTF